MADTSNNTGAPIEALLRERARYTEWLAKLDSASSGVPHAVRDKVRSDYDGRLRRVMEELKSHAATIRDELARHRSAQADLESRRSVAEEALAEASVRHTVGEYSDDEWRRLSEETSRALGLVQADLAKVRSEITRLVEVQALIADRPQAAAASSAHPPAPAPGPAGPPARALVTTPSAPATPSADAAATTAPPIDMLPDPTPDVSAAVGSASAVEPVMPFAVPPAAPVPASAPRFVPKPASEPARLRGGSAAPVDELAFLKSVSTDSAGSTGPASQPGRRSGETSRPDISPEPASAAPGGKNQAKTLKCGECGTLNRATEWYCERCGAELAAL
ncbi:MAG: zinc finger Ran-binding domain-containing protein [Gemmatimonadales bacterium]